VTEPLDRDLTQSKGRIRPLMLLPNFMTLGAVCVGLTSVRFALDGRVDLAVIALVLAMILDGLDGRVARALNSTSRIGKELDTCRFLLCMPWLMCTSALSESPGSTLLVAIMVVAACCATSGAI